MAAEEPFALNVADVIAAARAAFLGGRLSAQGPTPQCKYRDSSGFPCVIGVIMPDGLAAILDGEAMSIDGALDAGLVTSDDPNGLIALQDAHDSWASALRRGYRSTAEGSRDQLAALLGIESAQ